MLISSCGFKLLPRKKHHSSRNDNDGDGNNGNDDDLDNNDVDDEVETTRLEDLQDHKEEVSEGKVCIWMLSC